MVSQDAGHAQGGRLPIVHFVHIAPAARHSTSTIHHSSLEPSHMVDSHFTDWIALALALFILAGYELWHANLSRLHPASLSRSAHALMRRQWVQTLSRHADSEILAVQSLRNSLMSSTITASTAAIMLMGCMTLVVSNIGTVHGLVAGAVAHGPVKLVLILLMITTLFATYVCAAMSMRYLNHAGFLMSMPVGSPERVHYEPMCLDYVTRAGLLYGWSLRCFLFIAPLIAGLVVPLTMPVAALLLVGIMRVFDQPGPVEKDAEATPASG
jgi:hypothetical protein